VKRYLNTEPIDARPPSPFYRMAKFAKRRTMLAVSIVLCLAAVLAFATTSFVLYWHTDLLRQQQLLVLISEVSNGADECQKSGDYVKASKQYDRLRELQALAFGQQSAEVARTDQIRARIQNIRRKPDEAIHLFKQSVGKLSKTLGPNHPDTEAAVREMISVARQHSWELSLAEGSSKEKRKQSLRLAKWAHDRCQQYPNLGRNLDQRVEKALALAQYRCEQYEASRETALKIMEAGEPDLALFLVVAGACHMLGQHDEAVDWVAAASESYRAQVALKHSNVEEFVHEIVQLVTEGTTPSLTVADQASLYTRLLDRYPTIARNYRYRGYCYLQLGKWNDAAGDFAQAAKMHSDSMAHYLMSHAVLSLYQGRIVDYEQACKQLLRRVERRGPDGVPHEHLRLLLIVCLLRPPENSELADILQRTLEYPKLDPVPKGIATIRSGRPADAYFLLHSDIGGAMYGTTVLFRALSRYKQGLNKEAKRVLSTGRSILETQGLAPDSERPLGRVGFRTSVEWVIAYLVLQEVEKEMSQ